MTWTSRRAPYSRSSRPSSACWSVSAQQMRKRAAACERGAHGTGRRSQCRRTVSGAQGRGRGGAGWMRQMHAHGSSPSSSRTLTRRSARPTAAQPTLGDGVPGQAFEHRLGMHPGLSNSDGGGRRQRDARDACRCSVCRLRGVAHSAQGSADSSVFRLPIGSAAPSRSVSCPALADALRPPPATPIPFLMRHRLHVRTAVPTHSG